MSKYHSAKTLNIDLLNCASTNDSDHTAQCSHNSHLNDMGKKPYTDI